MGENHVGGDELTGAQREVLNDEGYWALYRELYRMSRSLDLVRWQVLHDASGTGISSKEIFEIEHGDSKRLEWESPEASHKFTVARVLLSEFYDNIKDVQQFMEFADEREQRLPESIEERIQEIPDQIKS